MTLSPQVWLKPELLDDACSCWYIVTQILLQYLGSKDPGPDKRLKILKG